MSLDIEKLKSLRERKGLTQEQCAQAAGFTSRQHWGNIESGRNANVTIEMLDRIAKALGVSAKSLLK